MKDTVPSHRLHAAHRHPTDRCPGFITDLILRCASGEEAALGSLFDHLYPLVASTARGTLPSDSSDALVLATFRRLWELAPTYDPKVWKSIDWVLSQARAELANFLGRGAPDGPGPAMVTR